MTVDPNNPVARILIEGLQAETRGERATARQRYEQAWAARTDDYEGAMAAHYVARIQDDPAERLRWNREAVDRAAAAAGDERVSGFFPSLYLNLGMSEEEAGRLTEARGWYELARDRLEDLPQDLYADGVRAGVEAALARTTLR